MAQPQTESVYHLEISIALHSLSQEISQEISQERTDLLPVATLRKSSAQERLKRPPAPLKWNLRCHALCRQANIVKNEATTTEMCNSDNGESRNTLSSSSPEKQLYLWKFPVNTPLRVLTSLPNL